MCEDSEETDEEERGGKMCEIQLMYRVDGKNLDEDDFEEMMWMTRQGGFGNSDATGIFTPDFMEKAAKNGTDFVNEKHKEFKERILGKTKFVVTHQRRQTGGKPEDNQNNHPFLVKNDEHQVVIVHNGIISNASELKKDNELEYKEETDSAVVAYLIMKKLSEKHDDENEKVEVKDILKDVAEELEGSFSLAMMIDGKLYYMRNSSAEFCFKLAEFEDGKTVIVGSTDKDTLKNAFVFSHYGLFSKASYVKSYKQEPAEDQIYEICDEGIKWLTSFEPKERKYTTTYGTYKNGTYVCGSSPSVVPASSVNRLDNYEDWDYEKDEWKVDPMYAQQQRDEFLEEVTLLEAHDQITRDMMMELKDKIKVATDERICEIYTVWELLDEQGAKGKKTLRGWADNQPEDVERREDTAQTEAQEGYSS